MSYPRDRRAEGRGWRAEIQDSDAPSGWRSEGPFRTKADAKAYIDQVEGDKARGKYISPIRGEVAFGARYEITMGRRGKRRESTREMHDNYGRSLLMPTWRDVAIGDITHDDVQDWIEELIDGNYAPSTIVRAHQLLSRVLDDCVASQLLAYNVCKYSELPTVDEEEIQILSPERVFDLMGTMDCRYGAMVPFLAWSGLRVGEALALRVGRLDPLHGEVDVVETLSIVNGKLNFGKPKTRKGKRRIPLPGFVFDMIEPYCVGKQPSDLVFTAPGYENGHGRKPDPANIRAGLSANDPIRINNWRKRFWYPAVERAGLGSWQPCPGEECMVCTTPPNAADAIVTRARPARHWSGLRIHDLRHTAVSYWIAQGANHLEVARWAGHAKVATVYDRYGHLFPRPNDPTIDRLDAMGRAAMEAYQARNSAGIVRPIREA